jgi:hypothetical protein
MNSGITSSWPSIAQQIMNGEFDDITESMRESLMTGLRTQSEMICKQAMMRLEEKQEPKIKKPKKVKI